MSFSLIVSCGSRIRRENARRRINGLDDVTFQCFSVSCLLLFVGVAFAQLTDNDGMRHPNIVCITHLSFFHAGCGDAHGTATHRTVGPDPV